VRIIGGELKGRRVELPRGSRARPTTGLIREQVLSLLTADNANRLEQGPFLDVFAASGITGFEALSRGAPQAYFVEVDPRHVAQIKRTAYEFGVEKRAKVLRCDARRCIRPLAKDLGDNRLAAAFVDPPFIPGFAQELVPVLDAASSLFQQGARIVLRSSEELCFNLHGLRLIESRGGGRARLYVLTPTENHELDPPSQR
jgi:16S rRNA (guanine966-N2)-methyltransferase